MENPRSPKFIKQRRFMTFLPVLVSPFVLLLFWALGGGAAAASAQQSGPTGLLRDLPEAQLNSQQPENKLMYYEHAAADSAHQKEKRKYDAYTSSLDAGMAALDPNQSRLSSQSYSGGAYNDPTAARVYQKLAELDQAISNPKPPDARKTADRYANPKLELNGSEELDKMARMMQEMEGEKTEDPELSQLQDMLEKIQQIQHPELLKAEVLPEKAELRIYQAVPAVISKDQKISQGTVIELRMLDTATFNGQLIPKGHPLYGIAELSNQRLNLRIKNIGIGRAIIPVDLTVFDQKDSMEGVYLPEAISSEAIRGGSDNALQGLQVLPMDQTVGTQLAGAGITAAKGLFSKKVRMLKGKVRAGYPVLLKNNQSK